MLTDVSNNIDLKLERVLFVWLKLYCLILEEIYTPSFMQLPEYLQLAQYPCVATGTLSVQPMYFKIIRF
jgi:hypothetical protein